MKSAFFVVPVALLSVCVSGSSTGSPVEKVVNLLKDLKTRLLADGTEEQQIYDKYACWCEKTTKRKAAAIEEARSELRALGQQILKLKGTVAVRTAEIAELTEKIRENEEAQREATAIRQKENAAYMAESVEMQQALAALEKAIIVLRDATKPAPKAVEALLQSSSQRAASSVRAAVEALPTGVALKLPVAKLSLLKQFAQGKAKYAPQSMTVQGILQDMYNTFSEDLESATQAEASKNRVFEDFIAAKQEELTTMQETMKKKEREKAEAETMLAEATQSYDDVEAEMKANIEFFDETKSACSAKSAEWAERKGLREEELAALEEALKILSSDDARELFDTAIKPGVQFLQEGSLITASFADAPGARAYAVLKKHAARSHSIRLAKLAAEVHSAKSGHFDKVIEAIDDIIQQLKDEEEADIAKRDQCKDEFLKIESTVEDLSWKIEKNAAKIAKLEELVALREEEKAQTIEAIEDVTKEIGEMEEMRIEENAKFKKAKTDDEQAIDLLEKAKAALASYYEKNKIELGPIEGSVKGAALAQEPEFKVSEDQAPDATFSHKGKRKHESKGIISLLTMIMEDLQNEIKAGIRDEEKAQLDFEERLAAGKKLKKELEEKKLNLETTIAEHKSDKEDEHTSMEANQKDKDDELTYKKEIKPDCDWIIGAFEKRRAKRQAEMEGLTEAKAFLAGYQPSDAGAALIDKTLHSKFDDDKFTSSSFASLSSKGLRGSA